MTRILYLTPGCFDKGGISRYGRYQIEALREVIGAENVRVLSLLGPDGDEFETDFDVAWHSGRGEATMWSRTLFSVRAVWEALLWRPNLIFCAHVNFTPLLTRLSRLCAAKTVLNVYGLELWSDLSPARAAHMARVDFVIADCHATAEHVRDKKMHPGAPFVFWDCVDLDRFAPAPVDDKLDTRYGLPPPGSGRVVLTLGRLAAAARHKGYDRLLEIWGYVCEQVPGAELLIAGRGDDATRLKAKAKKLGLTDSVTFTGPINEADLADIYRRANVFCLVSDKGPARGEGIPLTPLEAMACGIPILVGDEDGSREAVDGTRNGLVVSPRDLGEMAEALINLLSEPAELHAHRCAEARAVAEERFGYATFLANHRNFLKDIGRKD